MIYQKPEIIRRLESDEPQRKVMASYNTGSLTIHGIKKTKDQLQSFMASSGSVNDIFK
jgi:hypothetical protein